MSDMRGYVTPELSIDSDERTGKIVGGVVIAIAIGAAAVFSYTSHMWNTQPTQPMAAISLPRVVTSPAPAPVPQSTPLPQPIVAPPPVQTAPAQTLAPAPVISVKKTAHVPRAAAKIVAPPPQPALNQQPDQSVAAPAEITPAPLQSAPPATDQQIPQNQQVPQDQPAQTPQDQTGTPQSSTPQ